MTRPFSLCILLLALLQTTHALPLTDAQPPMAQPPSAGIVSGAKTAPSATPSGDSNDAGHRPPQGFVNAPVDDAAQEEQRRLLVADMIRAQNTPLAQVKSTLYDVAVTGLAAVDAVSMGLQASILHSGTRGLFSFNRILTRFNNFDYYTTPPGFLPYSSFVPEKNWTTNGVYNLSISYVRDNRMNDSMQVRTKVALYDEFLYGGQKQMLSLHTDAIGNFSQVHHGEDVSAITRNFMCITPDYIWEGRDTTVEVAVIRNVIARHREERAADAAAKAAARIAQEQQRRSQNDTSIDMNDATPLNYIKPLKDQRIANMTLDADVRLRVQSNPFRSKMESKLRKAASMLGPTQQLLEIHCILYKEEYNIVEPLTVKTKEESIDLSVLPPNVQVINRFDDVSDLTQRKNRNETQIDSR